jgi:NAD(P)-dependent dehydrogenase (short-subunit alcohol dehydrogenase family)
LGAATAKLLAEEGAIVIATSRKAPKGDLKNTAGSISQAALDVTDERSVRELFAKIEDTFGGIDVLVNNAGIGVFKPVTEISLAEWNEVIQTNLTGAFLCAREAFKLMKNRKGGRIINIGSVVDHVALPHNGAYGASKFGLRALSLNLNEEGKAFNIRVSLVSPGAVYTEIWHGREGFSADDMLQPIDIAQTVLDIAHRPLRVRIDEVRLMPPKGVL